MTSFFPDVNVWVALSDEGHRHSREAWDWLRLLPVKSQLILCRTTQVGLLRLLTNQSVMGTETKTLGEAWAIHDQWLEDPRVAFFPEPRNLDKVFRDVTGPVANQSASKLVGDCYLLAFAAGSEATMVTFDQGMLALARRVGIAVITP